jgi:hypothetical protein
MPVNIANKNIWLKKKDDFKCLKIIQGEAGILAFHSIRTVIWFDFGVNSSQLARSTNNQHRKFFLKC